MNSKSCDFSFYDKNLIQQGYQTYTPLELKQVHWGLRFTPTVCSLMTLYGLYMQNPLILLAVSLLGVWAFFFPAAHPMDLLYNHLVRKIFSAVKLPPNPLQRRLACLAAGIMNATAAVFFLLEMPLAALITGGLLLMLQAIVIFTHFCTLSWMFEVLMRALGKWSAPLDQDTAKTLLNHGALVVDVRGNDEFSEQRLDGSINIPLEQIENDREKLSHCPVLLVCASGTRSQIAHKKLQALGLENVYDMGSLKRAREIVEESIPA